MIDHAPPVNRVFIDDLAFVYPCAGLDSSTTFQIVKFLRDMAHLANSTIMVALLQPAPETFEIFDDVLLIAEGMPAHCYCAHPSLRLPFSLLVESDSHTKGHWSS